MVKNPKKHKNATDEFEVVNRRKMVAGYYLMKMRQVDIVATLKTKGLDINQSTVSRDLKAIKDQLVEESKEDVKVIVAQEIAGLNNLELESYAMLRRSIKELDTVTAMRVIDTILKIQESRRKLLGLDKPERFEMEAKHSGEVVVNLIRASCKEPIPEGFVEKVIAERKIQQEKKEKQEKR